MTDGRTDRRTDGGDCNIPDAFLKSVGIITADMLSGHSDPCLVVIKMS